MMDLDTQTMVEGLTLMTTSSPFFPLPVPEPIENPVQPALPVPLGFSVIAPGSTDSRDAAVDMNVFHCVHGHVDEFMLRETAKSLGVDILQ